MESKAKNAAILYKNEKVKKINEYYSYHKEIIDEFFRLKKEVDEADSTLTTIKINHALELGEELKKKKRLL